MTELKLDYTKQNRHSSSMKRLLLLAGIVMIGLSIAILVMVISSGISRVLIIPALANTMVGVYFILQSTGHKMLYPKKYIHISSEVIEYKLGGFFKEQSIRWDSVSRVSDEGKSIHIHSANQLSKINMLHFPLSDEKRIKASIIAIAEEKQL
jgi:hypothetical protein